MTDIRNQIRIAVENSPDGCTKWSPSEKMWNFKRGTHNYFNEKMSDSGFTITLHRPNSSTTMHLDTMGEVLDTLAEHEENYNKYVELDRLESDYLSSPEGAWGRSGT